MHQIARDILQDGGFTVVDSIEIPGRPAEFARVPRFLFDSRIGIHLGRRSPGAGSEASGLWAHQVRALEALGRGENLVISTGTASGKSLVFRAIALHKVLLDPHSRVVVFYPLKALVADQLRGWRDLAREMELGEEMIGRIDGSVPPKERDEVLRRARVIVMTPDVCHAWMMSRLSLPVVRQFVGALSTLVLDEAHTLEGVFGSNFAFLLRRLIAVRNHLLGGLAGTRPLQIVAATATIANPGEHLKRLTGSEFSVVDHREDGAPRYERVVAHVACPPGDAFSVAKDLQQRVLKPESQGRFITFVDSRKGVETLAVATREDMEALSNAPGVLPYRAGYHERDRHQIEERFRSGGVRGIVSTSALELGIDIPDLQTGFNVGIPPTRKAYRQRLGRVGRTGPGAFFVIAPANAFEAYGMSFEEYHRMSVEPSYLYLDNRFMQFAHGRCLADELDAVAASAELPHRGHWPQGFRDVYSAARPGGNRPPEFDAMAELGSDTPQRGYPLRNVGEVNFEIKLHENADTGIGSVNQTQALRECYPGATYLHMTRAYEVSAWRVNAFAPTVLVKRSAPGRRTRPHIRTWINASVNPADLIEGHLLRGESGFLAECRMYITERVEGYFDSRSGERRSYRELRQRNPDMRARARNFRTSGVVLCVDRDWFRQQCAKTLFADRVRETFIHEYSVLPQDVGSSATNISVQGVEGRTVRNGCIAVFDETYGSLRLTERLYLEFERILDRLARAAVADSTAEAERLSSLVERMRVEFDKFSTCEPSAAAMFETTQGHEQVFAKGSRVCFRQQGQLAAGVEIVQPTMMEGRLMYQVMLQPKTGQSPARRWVAASSVEPSGDADAWEYAWWNRATETYEDPPEALMPAAAD